jgi:disulfide bond formation protein DsbB
MSTDQVSLFLALLALFAELAAAGLVATLVVRALRPTSRWCAEVVEGVRPVALTLAAAVAIVATLGSLYYSEIADFPPCRLCWYQRIAMYPLAPILAIAAWRRDSGVRWYAWPLAVGGGLVSVWHILVEHYPSLESGACDPTNPCSIIWVEPLGYLTIPTMALSGFALITVLMFFLPKELP